ncbi:MAG: 30S ribosomal protein S1 [Chlorobia bacterium]|nr:30S ribosomal protein S1 [Fimbriimonadaceae bacterium]
MMIDENQTPVGEHEAQEKPETVTPASDAAPMEIPSDPTPTESAAEVEAPVAETEVAIAEPEAVTSPEPEAAIVPEPEVEREPEAEAVVEPEPEPEPISEPEQVAPTPEPESIPEPEQVAPTPEPEPVVVPVAAAPAKAKSDEDLFESYMSSLDAGGDGFETDGTFKKLAKGDRVEATIIQVDKDRVFVDLGTKSEGIVPLDELMNETIESAKDHFSVGDKINVVVLRPESAEGNPIVSKKRADFEETWDRIESAFKSQEMITAQVVDRVKGGLVVDVGVRGFVPATHVGSGKLRNIEKYVGQPLQLKVIEIDRERKKVVLSNREAEEQRRARAKEDIFTAVNPGDRLEGTVRRLTDYGAFIDLGGVDGLLHISEMSWMRINHPKEMFKEGQKIEVMVLRLDQSAGKISLGHRQVLPDPWNLIKQNYTINQKLTITIGRLVQSGAFVKLPEGAEAFLPVSEMSYRRLKRPQDAVEENQEVEVQIIDLRADERRMVLSMRATGNLKEERGLPSYDGPSEYGGGGGGGGGDDFRGGDKRGKPGAKKGKKTGGRGGRDEYEDFEEVAGRRGFATGGATIGERLGMLKGFLGRDEDDVEEVDPDAEKVETEAEAEPEEA